MSQSSKYKNFFHYNDHTLIKDKLTTLRDKKTHTKIFREILEEVTFLMSFAALEKVDYIAKNVETPITNYSGIEIHPVLLMPILRAGLTMLPPLQRLLPTSKVGFMGVSRNEETLLAKEYYSNIPKFSQENLVLILDPMLATGGTVVHTMKELLNKGAKDIKIISIVAADMALDRIFELNPNVSVYAAGYDKNLNDKGYIVPGLGDAGDRAFNSI